MKPLLPRPKKKPLIGPTTIEPINVGKIDKPNAESVALRDDKSDIAKGTESQIDDVAKTERDKAAEAKADAVAENTTGGVPQECDSKTNVERSTEAPQQQPQQSQPPNSSTDHAGTSAPRRTVSVGKETTEAATTTSLDNADFNVTQRVTPRVQAKAAPNKVRVLGQAWNTSRTRTCPLPRASRATLQASQRALGGTLTRSSSAWVLL